MSSTFSPWTMSGWNRRLEGRVLLNVLAVLHRASSRRRSAALRVRVPASRGFEASIAPSDAPAPTTVWSSSMKEDHLPLRLLDLLEDRLEPVLQLAAVLGPGDQAPPMSRAVTDLSLRFCGRPL